MDAPSTPPASAPSPSAALLTVDTRAAPEDVGASQTAPSEPPRKGSSEWASPRSRGRRGTPPPVPRRASRGEDELSGVVLATASAVSVAELPPRPRTPAQVLASRAAAAKASTTSVATAVPAAMATPPLSPTMQEEAAAGSQDKDRSAANTEQDDGADASEGPERRDSGVSAYTKEDVADLVGANDDAASAEDGDARETRRTSVQLSAVGSEPYDASEAEDGESFRRDDRVDTSTVDEESMYNDEDDEDDDENDEEGEYEDGDHDHESPGTSDSYVNIHGEHDGEEDDDDEDEIRGQQLRHGQMMGDDSLTPDSTPPPSPPRTVQQQQQRHTPPPIASEWVKYIAESGHEYYFNTQTQVSQWTRPAAMVLSPRSGIVEQGGGNDEEDGPEEENQIQHGEVSTAEMLPHLQVQLPQGYPQQQQPPLAVGLQHHLPQSTAYLENLFAAAAKNDETAQLQALLRYEVDVNAVNASGLTPLHVAVQHGNARGAAMLLDYGALVDGVGEDTGLVIGGIYASARLIETPLVMACRTNHASLVRLLVRYGASIYTRDNDSNTVLHIAIRCWSDEVLSCLLEMDSMAAIINLRNADDETPLHLAARHGNANAVRALLSSGASSDVEDAQGRTPLVVSIMENRVDCAQLLQGVGLSDPYGSAFINDGTGGEPAMYDSNPKEEEAAARQGGDELEGLRVYLMQLVQHATTDGVLVSTIYQYMDAVQREISAMNSTQAESRQREENLLSQIDELTNHESITSSDLAKEREENERLRHQLEAKEVELNSVQAAFESLSSRSTMLESIARSSQDKLRRERSEFARQEEYWNQTIENSLRENAALLESIQSLQQGWQGPPGSSDVKTVMTTKEDEAAASNEVYEDSYDPVQQPAAYTEFAAKSEYDAYQYSFANTGDDQAYDVKQSSRTDIQYRYPDQASADKKQTASTPSAKSEPERPISPERVDAVWNRFFENMSRVAEGDNATANPTSRNATLSPRQTAATVSMLPPASAVFDSIRKSSRDRMHQLLLSGISPNIRDLGEKGTPLHLASELGDLESVMLLCEFGADVEIRDENGSTPLLVACSQGHYECTKFLLQSAANQAATNASRDSALHLAAFDGSFECVEILLEYGVDVLARNGLGLTALTNLKTRSPLRHRFDDLSSDHPMAKTLMILEEAERFEKAEDVQPAQDLAAKRPKEHVAASTQAVKHDPDAKPQATSTSWGRWILGSVFGSPKSTALAADTAVSGDEDDDDDDDNKSDFEEAESSPSKLHAARLHEYEDLRLPPEIEAELRRKPLSPSSSDPLPPPPPEVLDALEKRKLVGGGHALLSPSSSATRFASPASIPPAKKSASSTPTNVRSRYVDTFNNP